MAVRLSSDLRTLEHRLRYEPTQRSVRADAGARTVIDSQDTLQVEELRKRTPVFAVPEADTASGARRTT
ncbi:hypothetical protein DQ353_21025 [Arthrobacter sp. AQ5-05]|nr:hypothetical protein DQ353_21025 [Arthrobacter sp. AQ5-05]